MEPPSKKQKSSSAPTPITGYDLTVKASLYADHIDLGNKLKQIANKFVFQLEKGEVSGYEHYQVRLRLIKKKRPNEAYIQFADLIKGAHWSPTCKSVHQAKTFNYVMKADTRLEGPWTEADFADPPILASVSSARGIYSILIHALAFLA